MGAKSHISKLGHEPGRPDSQAHRRAVGLPGRLGYRDCSSGDQVVLRKRSYDLVCMLPR